MVGRGGVASADEAGLIERMARWLLVLLLLAGCGQPVGLDYYIADGGNHRLVRMDRFDGRGWRTYGREGSGVGQFRQPSDVTLDPAGRVYVADRGNRRVVRMDDFQGRGWVALEGPFAEPRQLAVDPVHGRIFVADPGLGAVLRFDDMAGKGRVELRAEVLGRPADLGFDRFGRLLVADGASGRLVRLADPRGPWEVLDSGLPGIDAVSVGPDGSVYLVSAEAGRVVQLDEDLGEPRSFGGEGQLREPRDLTFDREGRLIVADSGNGRLVRLEDLSGADATVFGSPGPGKRQFSAPASCRWGGALFPAFDPEVPPAVAVPGRIRLYRPR